MYKFSILALRKMKPKTGHTNLNRRKDTRPVKFPSSGKIDILQRMDVRMSYVD